MKMMMMHMIIVNFCDFPPVLREKFTILGGKNSINHNPCVSKMCLKWVKRTTNVTFMTHPTGHRTHHHQHSDVETLGFCTCVNTQDLTG